jgi:hypothetical protein
VYTKCTALALLYGLWSFDGRGCIEALHTYITVLVFLQDELALLCTILAVEPFDDLLDDALLDDDVLENVALQVAPARTFRQKNHIFLPHTPGVFIVFVADNLSLLDFWFTDFRGPGHS